MKKLILTLASVLFSVALFAVAPITGTTTICVGSSTTLYDATPGGTWSFSGTAVAITGSTAAFVGVAAGTATVTYTDPMSGLYATATLTVKPAAPVTGITSVCLGASTTLSDAVSGGTWGSTVTLVAAVGLSSGIVTGLSAGTSTIYYTNGSGCMNTAVVSVVTAAPAITGSGLTCIGSTTALADAVPGGTWTSGATPIATINPATGVVTGASSGTSVITYSMGGSCTSMLTETVSTGITPIIGPTGFCVGASVTLSDATLGGTWTSSDMAVAAASGTTYGLVTGVSAGTATITYTTGGGCTALLGVTVSAASPISGASSLCIGGTTTLTDAITGGTWTSSATSVATIVYTTGLATGVGAGSVNITYTNGGGCASTKAETVLTAPPAITGPTEVCTATLNTLNDAISGGTWSSSNSVNATIGSISGIVTGVSVGKVTITYTIGVGCYVTMPDTVVTTPGPITGVTGLCIGASSTLADAGGGSWTSSNYSVAYIGTASSVLTASSAGTATITYSLATGCIATTTATVYAAPALTATNTPQACGSTDTLKAGGAVSYSWSPTTGLSCPTCASTSLDPTATTTYVVTGTDALGCANTQSVTVNGNRILGHITFSSFTPDTLDMKVWLINYNPVDSQIIALDSTSTCVFDSITYYEFDGVAAGSYMVKAKLLFDNPVGGSGYVPTYSLSSAYWYSAATVAHASGSDSLHINMVYGTVPAGPGFISGNVYSGAGKGTSGDLPVAGMLIYLQNTSTKILTSVYTDAAGAYTFTGLAYGSYVIYPEDYSYHTTPSPAIALTSAQPGATGADFRQYLTSKKILPYNTTSIKNLSGGSGLSMYPNPTTGTLNMEWQNQAQGTANVAITDLLGREVFSSRLTITSASGKAIINAEGLKDGVYQVTVKSNNIYYSGKLVVQQ
jgi:uncharacterized protein YjdB